MSIWKLTLSDALENLTKLICCLYMLFDIKELQGINKPFIL